MDTAQPDQVGHFHYPIVISRFSSRRLPLVTPWGSDAHSCHCMKSSCAYRLTQAVMSLARHWILNLGDAKFLASTGRLVTWAGSRCRHLLLVGSSLIMLTVYYRRRHNPDNPLHRLETALRFVGAQHATAYARHSGDNLLVQFF